MKVLKACTLAVATTMATAFGLLVLALTDADAEAFEFTPAGGELAAVPDAFREWIAKASEECHHPELSPALLAAQLQQESGFRTDRNTVSSADAQGPAQFIPSTWATWGRDEDGNGVADPFDIGDAVMAQGRYMCSLLSDAKTSGYGGDVRALALAGYNAGWGAVEDYKGVPPYTETQNYVRIILASIKDFQGPAPLDVHGSGTGPNALRKAATQLGLPYAYGGGTPNGPSTGFCDGVNGYTSGTCVADDTVGWDCSSLVQYALWPATQLPRTAAAQYGATSSRPVARADLQPGDLMFWRDSSGFIYHVALYADDGNVLHAPRTGQNVKIEAIDTAMPAADYLGATRP